MRTRRVSAKTTTVGSYKANAWALHDMHGSVYEWCRDWYENSLPGGVDPEATERASRRVDRGGGWGNGGVFCRSAFRSWTSPGDRFNFLGFRVAQSSCGNEQPGKQAAPLPGRLVAIRRLTPAYAPCSAGAADLSCPIRHCSIVCTLASRTGFGLVMFFRIDAGPAKNSTRPLPRGASVGQTFLSAALRGRQECLPHGGRKRRTHHA